jgi:hypothetical protein
MSPSDTRPLALLDQADAMRLSDLETSASYWARAAALLARMALETAVSDRLAAVHPDLPNATMRSRLLVLPVCADEGVVREAVRAWVGLSRACHHHPYELAPTKGELSDLVGAVRHVVLALGNAEVSGP